MAYPSSPWTLKGFALQTLHLVDIERVRPLMPSELEIVSVFPGKTLGSVYVASYGAGSELEYSELIVACAIANYNGKPGGWISHIYVDNPDSVAGGREIWGLPKEMAQFNWQPGNVPSVQVQQGDTTLCSFTGQWHFPLWKQPLSVPSYSTLRSALLTFQAKGNLSLNLAGVELQIPPESPFAELNLGRPWLGVYANPLHLTASTPTVLYEKALQSQLQ